MSKPSGLVCLCFALCAATCAPSTGQSRRAVGPRPRTVARVQRAAEPKPPPASSSTNTAPENTAPKPPPQLDPDGDDLPVTESLGKLPEGAHWVRVGRHWGALRRVCDLQAFGGALYSAHATGPLAWSGASLVRYRPSEKRPFELAFNWNRPGQPEKGGGAGQGFLRIRALDGRLYVPDADPPYLGFHFKSGIEGYVFVSNAEGQFARVRYPKHWPPSEPTSEKAGAGIVPRAYHLFDVIRFRGRFYTSIGAESEDHQARGALMASEDGVNWEYAADYPKDAGRGVYRLTYLVRFRDQLFSGVESIDGNERHDYVRWVLPRGETRLNSAHAEPVLMPGSEGKSTLRWYADRGKLYWIAWGADGVRLRVTEDGEHWRMLNLPDSAGAPTDILRFGDALVVLSENALLKLSEGHFSIVAKVEEPSPFVVNDGYCAAPLAVYDGELYAGGQRKGALFRLAGATDTQSAPEEKPVAGNP